MMVTSTNGAGTTEHPMKKKKGNLDSYLTSNKNKLRMDHNIKHGRKSLWSLVMQGDLRHDIKSIIYKRKQITWISYKWKIKILHLKRH